MKRSPAAIGKKRLLAEGGAALKGYRPRSNPTAGRFVVTLSAAPFASPPPVYLEIHAKCINIKYAKGVPMIKGFQLPQRPDSPESEHFQWFPATTAGLIAGVILLILPHASPWEGLTVFTPAIVGRQIPASWGMLVFSIVVVHLALSFLYGLIISLAVTNVRQLRALLVGGAVGLVLYGLNLGVVWLWIPSLRVDEVPVVITHFVFGLIAAGAYRGLLRRTVVA